MKIEISNSAAEFLKRKMLNTGKDYAVRVFIKSKGCCSLDLGIAFDLEKASDNIYNEKGVTFIIDRKMAKYIKGFRVDVVNSLLGGKVIIEDLYKSSC
ncbi:MAG: iron-sulfur cluster biosynthesis family protein [Bacillota bacterium]|nr:iron-sulfur cluster biosynthesis family protein [Bacillota bacterium]